MLSEEYVSLRLFFLAPQQPCNFRLYHRPKWKIAKVSKNIVVIDYYNTALGTEKTRTGYTVNVVSTDIARSRGNRDSAVVVLVIFVVACE